MILGDARDLKAIPNETVHLVVTSPPYFNLKPYASDAGGRQLGRIDDYDAFLNELDRVGGSASEFWFQVLEFVVS
jgi:DNA modification methylase